MNKKTFKTHVINPLCEEFNTEIYYNGKLARSKKLYMPASASGAAYINKKIKPIVIVWQHNFYDTVQTLFHEIGHITLHGKGTNYKGQFVIKEIEAELVAKKAFELLNLPYNPNFKINHDDNFLENYMGFKPKKAKPRIELINNCALRIYELLKDIEI